MEEIMLKIDNVSKQYKLGQIGGTTLRDELQRWSARIHGKEDPTKKIGAKDYNKGETFMALDGVSFEVKKGERVGIIGHNGAGKSTLLKLISRVTAPTGGSIGLNGRVASMLEVGTGFHGELTGRENIYMNGAILGMTKKEIDAKMEDIIEFSEVRQFIDTPVKRYSSGMYVKLAFSVAAHLDSEIMIMDEVLAVGDVNFQQKCLEKMRWISETDGRTILYVSHNMTTIRRLCDRCIVLNCGQIVFDGNNEDAIAIYSASKNNEHKLIIDTRNNPRKLDIPNVCRIQQINAECCELLQNQELGFSLFIESKQQIEYSLLRVVLFDHTRTTIATAYSEPFALNIGNNYIKLVFDTSLLAPDEYSLDIILIDYNNGRQIRNDLLVDILAFSIEEDEYKYNMAWRTNSWGHIVLNTVKVVNRRDICKS